MNLTDVMHKYATPDPSIVSQLKKSWKDKNNQWHEMYLDYVGHADLTKILIEIDENWTWEPLEIRDGAPVIVINGDTASMWIRLTLLGKSMLGVGTCKAEKDDAPKELIGDALRNAAMRFGIAINLWSRSDSADNAPPQKPSAPISRPQPSASGAKPQAKAGNKISEKQIGLITKLAREKNITNIVGRANAMLSTPVGSLNELSSKEASELISSLMSDNPMETFFKDEPKPLFDDVEDF
jgi:hypothetical protein